MTRPTHLPAGRFAARALALVALFGLAPRAVEAQSATPPASALVGVWRGPVMTDGPSGIMTVTVLQEAGAWRTTTTFEGEGIPPAGEVRDFRVEGNVVTWTQSVAEFDVSYRATLDGDLLRGELEAYQGGAMVAGGVFELKKQPPAGSPDRI